MQVDLGVYSERASGAANAVSTRRASYLYSVKPTAGECIKQLSWTDMDERMPCIDAIEPGAFNDLADLEYITVNTSNGTYNEVAPMSYSGLLWQFSDGNCTLLCCPQKFFQGVNAVDRPGVPNSQGIIIGSYAFYKVQFRIVAPSLAGSGLKQFCFTEDQLAQVNSVGDCAFMHTNLEKLTFWPEVSDIGMYAFAHCHHLTNVDYLHADKAFGLTKISTGMFYDCDALEEVTLPEGVTYIGTNAFANCKRLKCVKIPASLSCICKDAFKGCGDVKIIIPSSSCLRHIGIKEYIYLAGEPNLSINRSRTSDIPLEHYRNNYAIQNVCSLDAVGGNLHFEGETSLTKIPYIIQKLQGGTSFGV